MGFLQVGGLIFRDSRIFFIGSYVASRTIKYPEQWNLEDAVLGERDNCYRSETFFMPDHPTAKNITLS